MIEVGSLCEINGNDTAFLSFMHLLNKTFGYGIPVFDTVKHNPLPDEPKGANIDLFLPEEVQKAFSKKYGNTKFMPNGTVGLIVWQEGDWTRMLIEDKLYEVPTDKLKEIAI